MVIVFALLNVGFKLKTTVFCTWPEALKPGKMFSLHRLTKSILHQEFWVTAVLELLRVYKTKQF